MNKISILVPTWRRPEKLINCLTHLKEQTVLPYEIIVIVRETDLDSIQIINNFQKEISNLKYTFTYEVGVVAAENAGLKFMTGDIVSFIDDDGYAPRDWIEKINQFFQANPNAAAYGGSDLIKSEPWTYHDVQVTEVGIITWYGKIIGNHHRKSLGALREVQVLKGVNMSFRRDYFDLLDERLTGKEGNLGNGSQWELDLCLRVSKRKGKIYFDPNLVVLHDSDHSQHNHLIAAKNNAHNLSYVMFKNLSFIPRIVFVIYALLIGNSQLPGIFILLRDLIFKRQGNSIKFYYYKLTGFISGIKTWIT